MANYHIKKGRDISLKGAAEKRIVDAPTAKQAAIQPPDFKGLKLKLAVKEGDQVKMGSVLLFDKNNHDIKLVSPLCGKVAAINRGAKRALLEVVVESNGQRDAEQWNTVSDISSLPREDAIKHLLEGGLWCALRQRPFSKVANPNDHPKSIFVHAMSTEPLAPDYDVILEGQEELFQKGLDILKRLTDGKVHLCVSREAKAKALTSAGNVDIHTFSGSHPAGNVSTHIQAVDPLNKGEIIWWIEAQDVLRLAQLFQSGQYPAQRMVAVTGEGAKDRLYYKTIVGAPLLTLLKDSALEGQRCISGSVLTGRHVGAKGFVGFYDHQITVIPEGGKREFLGWMMPGFNKFTLSKTYASAFLPATEASVNTDENGGHRAIVLNHIYDSMVALDVPTYFLLKAIISGDLDEAEKLGVLECDEEDFALATFACPSKVNVGQIIRQGLDAIEKEG